MQKKIRIAMLGAYPLDSSRIWGGVQAAYAYLVKGLIQSGSLEIHILTIRQPESPMPDRVDLSGLQVHLLPTYPRFERLRGYRAYQAIVNRELAQIQPDLVHAQDAGADALVAIRSGYPTLTTVHGIRWEDGKHYTSLNKRLHTYFDSLVTERYVISHARHLIAISRYVTGYFKRLLRPDVAVYQVPNAIDERFFNLTSHPEEPVVLFAGRVLPRKRVMELVHAFAQVVHQVPAARLRIAGEISTEPGYVASIRQWVHQAQLDEHVQWLGPISEERVLQEFAGCSLLALASAQETAPMVIAQAMAAGKPVVATRVGGVGEMVGEDGSRGVLVDMGDSTGLAAGMTRLLQNPDLIANLGQCGREFALEHYHLASVARRTQDVYRSIVFKEQKAND